MPYVVRDLAADDYEACDTLLSDPVYGRIFALLDLAELHVQCSYAAVAELDGEICGILMVGPTPQYFPELPDDVQASSPPGTLAPRLWSEYVSKYYSVDANRFLTEWVRLLTCLGEHVDALSVLVQTYFGFDPYNETLLLLVPPHDSLPHSIRRIFPELAGPEPINPDCSRVHCCSRPDVLPPLEVRQAEMKDHDDLVAIFESQNTSIRERFGEFFVASLITSAKEAPTQKLSLVALDYECYSLDYIANAANAIRRPVSFCYIERCNPQSKEDLRVMSHLARSHSLEKYRFNDISYSSLAFIRATATLPIAESRCGELIGAVFEQWPDLEALILSLPSAATCTDMQMLRLFTLVDARSPLSPRESLFICHRDVWLGTVETVPVRTPSLLDEARDYLRVSMSGTTPMIHQPFDLKQSLEPLQPGCSFGSILVFNTVGTARIPIAMCVVDLNVGRVDDGTLYPDYLDQYYRVLQGEQQTCEVPLELTGGVSLWGPPLCLGGRAWCKMHYDRDLSRFAYLKAFWIDPMFLQFKDAILNTCIETAGVDGFLLSVDHDLQKVIRPVYDAANGSFVSETCDATEVFTPFEKEILRFSTYIPNVVILPDERDSHVIRPAVRRHYNGTIPTGQAEKSAERLADEARFNEKMEMDYQEDMLNSAIRVLTPHFSLFAILPSNHISHFASPIKIANDPEPSLFLIKPPVTFTDRLLIIGGGMGLLSALIALHDCAYLARFKNVVAVTPPPGIITPYSLETEGTSYELYIDHGESLPRYRDRILPLLFDICIGDIVEISLETSTLKLASGTEFGFDIIFMCPEGNDGESFRLVPTFNLNSAVSFTYGIVDPLGGMAQGGTNIGLLQNQANTFNTRGYKDQTLMDVIAQPRYHSQLLASLITEHMTDLCIDEGNFYERLLAPRLNARLFFRYLTKNAPISKRQLSALYNSTISANLRTCVNFLYSATILKRMAAKNRLANARLEDGSPTRPPPTNPQQPAAEEEQKATAQLGPYRLLSAYAKSSQIIQTVSPEALIELPLICKQLADITNEAREQLFPSLSQVVPPRGTKGQTAAPTTTATVIDAARTSVAVVGSTFESFSVIQCLLDFGVAPSSIFLLLPADPTKTTDQLDIKNDNVIDSLVAPPGYGQYSVCKNSVMPVDNVKHNQARGRDTKIFQDKSTSQTASKRDEAFPKDLHAHILEKLGNLGVNILKNVRIVDVLCSLNGLSGKGLGKIPGLHDEEEEEDDEYSDEDESDAYSNDVAESDEESDEESADNADNMNEYRLAIAIREVRDSLDDLDAADMVLNSRIPNFAEELEVLDDVCDALLMGDTKGVLIKYLADGDNDFDPNVMDPVEQKAELFSVLRKRVQKLSQHCRKILARKKKYRKKLFLGASLCGLRLGLRSTGTFAPDAEMGNTYGDDLPSSIILTAGAMTRIVTGNGGSIARLQINNAEPSPQIGCLDIHVCAVFLTEAFGVPFHYASALMRSDLVFDRTLIVNSHAQTSDPRVYAACNLGKVSRATLLRRMQRMSDDPNRITPLQIPIAPHVLTADPAKPVVDWSLFSPAESARYAIYRLLSKRLSDFDVIDDDGLVPEFTEALVLNCRVPGGYVFRVARPLRDVRDPELTVEHHFRVIETGNLRQVESGERWCHLEIDPLGVVDSIAVFSQAPLHPDIKEVVFKVIGLPSALLNNIDGRWSRGEVPDLIDFICKPQVQYLLTDRILETINEITSDILTSADFNDIRDKIALGEYVGDGAGAVSDISVEALHPHFGRGVLSGAAHGTRVTNIVMDIVKELVRQAKDRYPELGQEVQTRGVVEFDSSTITLPKK
ncbi:hypothetical protein GMRT_11074 [Giardia muris]|uniref:Uncharacterized protein n=1 Tax=Giardia muris TaxID=5742 RepID=A0A4Z1SZE4_GIAMU|nr:hypothetical protein GMRT_11074 [Giardia muris]|eukprot:TNJ30125.1 hypothetical protein GMRT_11074 [Giardia muris]